MKIYIMEKRGDLFSVVLRGFVGLCISQDMFKGAGSWSRLPAAKDSR
jgi:hypothetical protein